MFTAGEEFNSARDILISSRACAHQLPPPLLLPIHFRNLGPISESDFFTWEALICGPKDTPFVRSLLSFFFLPFPFMLKSPPLIISGRWRVFRQIDIRASESSFAHP